MKKCLSFAVALTATTMVFGQLLLQPLDDELLQVTGGWLIKPGTQKGEIVYVNCQKAAKEAWLLESADYWAKASVVKVSVKPGTFNVRAPEIQGALSLFIIDDPELPMSLVAPEARWAVMNVAKLRSEKEAFFRARVKKELSRVFCMLCGGFKSNFSGNLTDAIVQAKDLDKHMDASMPVDIPNRFQGYLAPFGVVPGTVSSYQEACEQGWAPAPTNKYQQAVWDQVHALPSSPMKIEFDPKKGR